VKLGTDLSVLPTDAQIHQVPYVTQILEETLRLWPAAPAFTRRPYEDTVIGDKFRLGKDSGTVVLVGMLHRDKQVWGENPEAFDPDRFSPENRAKIPPNAYKPFGTGQRACIGRQFALQEATLVLSMLLQRFELIDFTNYQLETKQTLTIKPSNFYIKVRLRAGRTASAPLTASRPAAVASEPAALPTPTADAHQMPLLVLYGSNLGTAEGLAHTITVSALPSTLFTLPAGAIADMVDRKRILLAVQLWHASIAIALAILWMAHLLNPYLILVSAFLFSLGFAFSSPAQSAAFAEMVSSEELASAYTLGGLQMNLSGIIGPLLGALLIPLIGVTFIFVGNGVGFLVMFLVILGWQRLRTQSKLPLENFFESFTTAIRYVHYAPGIRILLFRHALFSFFIAIIPSLMPVLALKELHLKASHLGYLFTSQAVGSVISGAFIIPRARAKYSPQQITTGANLLLVFNSCLMVLVHQPFVFLVVAALGGMGWTLSASELWVASQRAMPDWARGRMNATMVMVSQGATALGGVIWGLAAHHVGVVPTFLVAAGFGILLMIISRVVPGLQISIDFTKSLSFEPAPVTISCQHLDTGRVPRPKDGPISIIAEFRIAPSRRKECLGLMRETRLIFLRNGAYRWHLNEDLHQPNLFRMEVVAPSWKEHLLQNERLTKNEQEVIDKLRSMRVGPDPPEEWLSLSVDREVLKKS
jgi:MFS family permease